jgi:hypothetical protein
VAPRDVPLPGGRQKRKTVDFFLSRKRDVNAAKAFLRKAMKGQRTPTQITLDAYAAPHRAVAVLKEHGKLPKRVLLRSSNYLNNLIEQDHRRIKQRLRPMLGLKSFRTAAVVIGGIELAEKIKSGNSKSAHSAAARPLCPSSAKLRSLPSLGISSNCSRSTNFHSTSNLHRSHLIELPSAAPKRRIGFRPLT